MKLFFSGIGGAGLGPLALLALDAGHEVQGSDLVRGLFIDELVKRGVQITIDPSPQHLAETFSKESFDALVVSAALLPTHPDIVFAAQNAIPILKRHDIINDIIKAKNLKLISISGTHGKTTTTAMMVWAMQSMGLPVSYSIGSNISFGPSARYEEGSEYFIYEADEFDRNFLQFESYAGIISSLDYDHPDTYPTQQDYYNAFADFIGKTDDSIVLWHNDYQKIEGNMPMTSYVKSPKPFIVDANRIDPSTVSMMQSIKLIGQHNRENAFLILTLLVSLVENDIEEIIKGLSSFPGTQRRFETIKPQLISDYAHHPHEIKATIAMGREYMQINGLTAKLVAIYQPHQNIRQHEALVQEGYKTCFAEADKVYWLPTYLSRENDLEVLSPEYLSSLVQGAEVGVADLDDKLATKVSTNLQAGDLVLFMGAGSIDGWVRGL
jgi:UDP-N-acetylmuramate--alanine ligase